MLRHCCGDCSMYDQLRATQHTQQTHSRNKSNNSRKATTVTKAFRDNETIKDICSLVNRAGSEHRSAVASGIVGDCIYGTVRHKCSTEQLSHPLSGYRRLSLSNSHQATKSCVCQRQTNSCPFILMIRAGIRQIEPPKYTYSYADERDGLLKPLP